MVIAPYAVLFIGRVLVAPDPIAGLSAELPSLPPILAQSLLVSGLLGSIAMAISAFTPRRAYATVGIIAAFLIPSIVVALVTGTLSGSVEDWIVLLSPIDVLDGSNAALFDARADSEAVRAAGLDPLAYYGATLAGIAVALGVTIRRYLRIAA
jgi:hypothetical protein